MKCTALVAIALAVFVVFGRPAVGQPASPSGVIIVAPERVEINLFYSGANIEVGAQVPAGYEVAIRLMTHPERLELKRLGKRAGVLWMSAGDVTFENLPVVYQVLSSAPLADMGPQTERAQWMLGYDSLVPDSAPGASWRGELVGLKEHDGLFAVREGALQQGEAQVAAKVPLLAGAAGAGDPPASLPHAFRVLRGTFRLPARAPAGDYTLDLIGFKDQRAAHLGSATLHVEQAGAVRTVRELALDHGLTYGIAASLFAIVAGLLTGRLFRSKADEGH
jgi:Putative transmembrane protein (Alph_Pro_TM)